MNFETIGDRRQWNEALLQLPTPSILQSWEWGEHKSHWGWNVTRRLGFGGDRRPAAAAQILSRPIAHTPFRVMYVPRGPVLDENNADNLAAVLDMLQEAAQREKALFIKLDAAVPLGADESSAVEHPAGRLWQAALNERGWRFSAEQVQFRNTLMLDLTAGEEQLLARMKPKWRYNLRLAQKKGVFIRQGEKGDLAAFFGLYAETSRRDHFIIRPRPYYLEAWELFMQAGMAHLLLAEVENQPAAGLMLLHWGETVWFFYGASANNYRNLMPNHALQWQALLLAKNLGCRVYDLWGAPDNFMESDRLWGVYRFKLGMGGHLQRTLGAYDYAPQPWLYRAYNRLLPLARKIRRSSAGGKSMSD